MTITRDEFDRMLPEIEPDLRGYIAGTLRRPGQVDDVFQETLLKAYRHLDSLRDSEKVLPWLKQIALNEIRVAERGRTVERRNWAELYDRAVKAAPDARQAIFAELDSSIRLIAGVKLRHEPLLTTALHFLFDWTVDEIAVALSIKPKTVYYRINTVKKRMQDVSATDEAEPILNLKLNLHSALIRTAFNPVSGPVSCNRTLTLETYALGKLLLLQGDSHPFLIMRMMESAYCLARLNEYEDLSQPPLETDEWTRAKWDQQFRHEAEGYFKQYESSKDDPGFDIRTEAMHLLYSPLREEDVQWSQILKLALDYIDVEPKSDFYLQAAEALQMIEGPEAAARFLETHRGNERMRERPAFFYKLAHQYYRAGNWKLARRNYEKSLQWPNCDPWLAKIRARISDCESHGST